MAVRFHSGKSKPRNYLARGEQRRLLTMVLLLGAVLWLMHHASQPSSWYWFVALSRPAAPAQVDAVDTRLALASRGEELPGTIIVQADKPAMQPGKPPRLKGVRADALATVKDDTVFRGAEHEAFFHLLELLDTNDAETLARSSLGRIAFVQLFEQPDQYRGQVVSLEGTVHRATKLPATKNEYGITHYYQLWLQPFDAPGNPLVLYVLDLPEAFPTGEKILEDIQCEAIFFKRWAYRAQDAIRSTPLLLAKNLRWTPPAPKPAALDWQTIASVLTGGLLMGGLVIWFAFRGTQPSGFQLPHRASQTDTFSAERLSELANGTSPPSAEGREPDTEQA